MFSWLFALSLDQVQEEVWTAKDSIRNNCDIAWEFLDSTSAVEETVHVLRIQVEEDLAKFTANEKVQALTSGDRNFVLEQLHQHANKLKYLLTSVCETLPNIIDDFEGISSRLLDEDVSVTEEDVLMEMRELSEQHLSAFEKDAIEAGVEPQYWRVKKQQFAKILFHHIQRLLDEAVQEAIRGHKEAALDAIDDVLAITIPGAHDLRSAKDLVNEVARIQYEGQQKLETLSFSPRNAITGAQEEIRAASDTFIRQVQMFHAMKDPASLDQLVPEVELIEGDAEDDSNSVEELETEIFSKPEKKHVDEELEPESVAKVSQETEGDEEGEQEVPTQVVADEDDEEQESKRSTRRKSTRGGERTTKSTTKSRSASSAGDKVSAKDAREAARKEVQAAAERRASAVQGTPSTRKRKAASDDKPAAAPVSTRKTRRGT